MGFCAKLNGLNGWLESYCRHELREPEFVSLMYRILHEGHVQRPPPKDKILCMDSPRHVSVMRVIMRRLPDMPRNCIWMRFSYPMKENGQLYSPEEIASFLGLSRRGFYRSVKAGKRRIVAELDRMAA